MNPALARAAWLLPASLSLLLFWPGIQCWFFQDDFAWLGLVKEVHSVHDLLRALFEPRAQGTIRPWSERAFFMGFFTLFGLEALPFRIAVFATYLLDLYLVYRIGLALSMTAWGAAMAVLFWGVNHSLGIPLSWTSSYNQVLVAAFLLGALLLFIRYTQTGRRGLLGWCWAVFVLGFGALEWNVVFPALAAAYAVLYSRKHLVAAPMFGVSGAYVLIHNHFAPKVQTGPYAAHWDPASVLGTLGNYYRDVFGGGRLGELPLPEWLVSTGSAAPWILTAALVLFLLARLARRDWAVLFGPACFVILLTPVLPLRDHMSYYYLTLPAIGLALLGGQAFEGAMRGPVWAKLLGVALCILYVGTCAPVSRAVVTFNKARGRQVRDLVFSVERARELHPNKLILLTDVSSDLFWAGILDKPFRLLGVEDVFLAPGAEDSIQAHPELGNIDDFVLPPAQALAALDSGKAVVYSFNASRLRNVTSIYSTIARTRFKPGLARRVDAGHPSFEPQLGPGWYPAESGYRWMSQKAVVFLGGPEKANQQLHIQGFCPANILSGGTVRLAVTVAGQQFPVVEISKPDASFEADFPLPVSVVGQEKVEVVLAVDHAYSPPAETRPLGLAFGSIGIR